MNHLLPKFTLRVTALALTAFACAAASVAQTMAMSTKLEHVIVVDIKDDTTEDERQRIVRSLGGRWIPNSRFSLHDGIFRVFFNGNDRDKKLAILRQHAFVEAADEEHTFTLDPDFSTSASLTASSNSVLRQGPVTLQASKSTENVRPNDPRYHEQWNFQMVGAESAWKHTNGSGVIVAVIDTGVAGIDSSRGRACRDFGTTRFVPGYDFVNNDSQPYDDHGHGTHVAGTIAESTNNAEGVAGLAFGASIMPIKVLSASGSGTSADIAAAICWAVDNGANVINMSLGSPFPDAVIRKACVYASKKNVIIVAAAGNSGKQGVGYPAAYPECIAVSAVGPSGKIAGYSSWGKQVALITDARFSGVSTGACIGHVGPEALAGGPVGKLLDGDLIQIIIDTRGLVGTVNLVAQAGDPADQTSIDRGNQLLSTRKPRIDLACDPLLPDDTRLWALLQQASGGTWGGCVYDVDAIARKLNS